MDPIQFVQVDDQNPAAERRQARAHAARAAHRRQRRARVIEFQSNRHLQQEQQIREQRTEPCSAGLPSRLPAHQQAPFANFPWPLSSVEHFLFNHCKATGDSLTFSARR